MAYSEPHQLLTFRGDGWTQQEEWQFGLRLRGPLQTPSTAVMQSLASAATALIQNTSVPFTDKIRLVSIKHARITEEGLYPPAFDATEYFLPSPLSGTSGASAIIPQSTMSVSLNTDRTRGLASRGRIYPPPQNILVEPDGRQFTSGQTQQLTLWKTFLDAVNGVGLGSIGVFSKVGLGETRTVLSIRIGRVVDTQRRRRESIPEMYATADLAGP